MRVLIDTNVLISAALKADGSPWLAYQKAVSYPNHGLICEQNVDELKRIFNKKFPHRLASLDKFLSIALLTLELVSVPDNELTEEALIRDVAGGRIYIHRRPGRWEGTLRQEILI